MPGKDVTRNSEVAGQAPKQYSKRAMTNEEAIQNACQDMSLISRALQPNSGQMTVDQTRSYRNSLRGTQYGQSVYRGGGPPKGSAEEKDDDNLFDQSSSSDEDDPADYNSQKPKQQDGGFVFNTRPAKTEGENQADDHEKFEIPLGTPQFSQANATHLDDQNADFELDVGDTAKHYNTTDVNEMMNQ